MSITQLEFIGAERLELSDHNKAKALASAWDAVQRLPAWQSETRRLSEVSFYTIY